jgi:uncharacterized protein YbjT (DUF2867 family)
MQPILVTGGTGTLGRSVVQQLLAAGHEVRALSRRPHPPGAAGGFVGDLTTGAGLDQALAGAGTIVHCASDPRRHSQVDLGGSRNLIEAARRAGDPHLVYISIVGVDRVPSGYYRTKLEVERMVEASSLPWTILRATQFHDLIFLALEWLARLPVLPVPAGFSFQPIDAGEVAAELAALAAGEPRGRAPDMGGPEVRGASDLARTYLRARHRRRPVLPLYLPGSVAAGFRRGGHLAPDRACGRRTWEDFLAERTAAAGRDRGR